VTLDSLGNVLLRFIKPYFYDEPASILEQRVLQMLMHLGIIRLGEDEQFGKVVQMSKLGSSIVNGVYVAHDDRIILPEQ
jgi:hypothetical protein